MTKTLNPSGNSRKAQNGAQTGEQAGTLLGNVFPDSFFVDSLVPRAKRRKLGRLAGPSLRSERIVIISFLNGLSYFCE